MENQSYWQSMEQWKAGLNCSPFFLLLFFIAVLPFVPKVNEWWEKLGNKLILSGLCALAGIWLYVAPTGDHGKIWETFLEYAAFLSLLGALFTVSGGIHISGAFAGLPYINTLFLGLGGFLASFLGTTGASMILIRPLLRANRLRKHKTHIVVFFIFIVSNCGGVLTPLGDPPLYLGFLRGVPFFWTFRLIPVWALILLILLFIFHILDDRIFDEEEKNMRVNLIREIEGAERTIHIQGWPNVFFLFAILATILVSGDLIYPGLRESQGEKAAQEISKIFQIFMMTGIGIFSHRMTSPKIHYDNQFSFAPIQEVAVLFLGIFGSMIPTLALLEAKGQSLALAHPWQYFWFSGFLSSFLDNAPTYLSFATLAAGQNGLTADHLGTLAEKFPHLLAAISCGSVLMGANSYIGNGPNFMVKAIAEYMGVKMPSFGGYLLWSLSVLVPVFILVTFVFFG